MKASSRVEEVLEGVLPHGADVTIVDEHGDQVIVEVKSGPRFSAMWLDRGWPRQVRDALEDGPKPDLLIAPAMSPGARVIAEEAGVGWADESGGAAFAVGSIVVARDPRRGTSAPREASWTPAVLAVVEAFLTGTRARVSAVAERTDLSSGTASKALRLLTDAGFLAAAARRGRHSGRWLADPAGMLDTYADQAHILRGPLALQVGVGANDPVGEVLEVAQQWTGASRPWAATGALAAHFQAPFLQRPAPLEVYVDVSSITGLEAAAREARLPVIEGGRLTLRPFPSPATERLATTESRDSARCRCVPWPRTFADLRAIGVRGEEAAEHLRDRFLPPPEQPDV